MVPPTKVAEIATFGKCSQPRFSGIFKYFLRFNLGEGLINSQPVSFQSGKYPVSKKPGNGTGSPKELETTPVDNTGFLRVVF